MSYSNTSNVPQRDIKYLNKDFNTLKNQLIEYAQTYYPQTFNDFSDEMFDFVYIDGLHDYKSVYEDLTCVFSKVKSGGVIAGHDYWGNHGVIPAVNEFIKTKNIKKWFPPINSENGCDGNSDFFFIKP